MNDSITLPAYSDQDLAELSPAKLIDIILKDANRVPRNVIDECARNGDAMTEYLFRLNKDDFLCRDPEDDLVEMVDGIWWLPFHAAMILGKIPGEQAGLLLVKLMRLMSQDDDDGPQDWIAGYWPALFLNKPDSVLPALIALCEDSEIDVYMRANAVETQAEPSIHATSIRNRRVHACQRG